MKTHTPQEELSKLKERGSASGSGHRQRKCRAPQPEQAQRATTKAGHDWWAVRVRRLQAAARLFFATTTWACADGRPNTRRSELCSAGLPCGKPYCLVLNTSPSSTNLADIGQTWPTYDWAPILPNSTTLGQVRRTLAQLWPLSSCQRRYQRWRLRRWRRRLRLSRRQCRSNPMTTPELLFCRGW